MNAISIVTAPSLFEDWTRARVHLLPALARCNGTHTENDLLAGIIAGQYRLWLGKKSAVLTEFISYPKIRCLHWFLVGGDLDEIIAMEGEIVAWAKASGCTRETCAGRRGWEKALAHWRFAATLMYRDLDEVSNG